MVEDDIAQPAIAGRALLSALLGAAGTGAMGFAGRELFDIAGASAGTEALLAWVLVGAAVLGALLCLRFALVWMLAAAVLAAGPTGRTGTALLAALRVLAPRLARRLTTGAALATAATALTFGPALAAPASVLLEDDGVHDAPMQQTAQMLPVDAPVPSDGGGEEEDATAPASPPPLGWGETASPAPTPETEQDEEASDDDAAPEEQTSTAEDNSSGDDAAHSAAPAAADTASDTKTDTDTSTETDTVTERTITVHTGDSLWSISRDLLGQGAATDPEIAAAWPLLHAANQDRIGADPDLLHPGLELVVPAELTLQDTP